MNVILYINTSIKNNYKHIANEVGMESAKSAIIFHVNRHGFTMYPDWITHFEFVCGRVQFALVKLPSVIELMCIQYALVWTGLKIIHM